MSDIDYPTYTLDKFNVKGIKGNIKGVTVEAIKEFKYNRAGNELQACKVLLKDKTERWLTIWKSEENLSFIRENVISISAVESKVNTKYNNFEIKICKESVVIVHNKKTVNTGETVKVSKTQSTEPMIKTETVDMPYNPKVIESKYIFYPAFDYPQLRKLHTIEDFDVRAQIELVMQNKQILDAIIRVGNILKEMMNK